MKLTPRQLRAMSDLNCAARVLAGLFRAKSVEAFATETFSHSDWERGAKLLERAAAAARPLFHEAKALDERLYSKEANRSAKRS